MANQGPCDHCRREAKFLYTSIDPNTGKMVRTCDECDRRLANIRLWRQLQLQKPEKVSL